MKKIFSLALLLIAAIFCVTLSRAATITSNGIIVTPQIVPSSTSGVTVTISIPLGSNWGVTCTPTFTIATGQGVTKTGQAILTTSTATITFNTTSVSTGPVLIQDPCDGGGGDSSGAYFFVEPPLFIGIQRTIVDSTTTATASSGSSTLTVASASNIGGGQNVFATGIPPGTQVVPVGVSGTTVTLTQATTAALSSTPITFSYQVIYPILPQVGHTTSADVVTGTTQNLDFFGPTTTWLSTTPTFTLAGCATASLGTPTIHSDTWATIPVIAGASDCAGVTVTDSTTGASASFNIHTQQTFYVRPDGGIRYSNSTDTPSGQCNGLVDASASAAGFAINQPWLPYLTFASPVAKAIAANGYYWDASAGTGTLTTSPTFTTASTYVDGTITWTKDGTYTVGGANCAFNQVWMLYADGAYASGSSFPQWGWLPQSTDTVFIEGTYGTSTYQIGVYNNSIPYYRGGLSGGASGSGMPPPPPGVPGYPTRILGQNYASCPAQSQRASLWGSWSVGNVISLRNSPYVDVQCLDITDHSECSFISPQPCTSGTTNYSVNGIATNYFSMNDTIQDISIHGMTGEGMYGPPGDGTTVTNISLLGNAGAAQGGSGWNMDDGTGTTGWGSLVVTNATVGWNGCSEEYPVVDSLPYRWCNDQLSGGFGDGIGTTTTSSNPAGFQYLLTQSNVFNNTQDGNDALHVTGVHSTVTTTRSFLYGNMGQQLKVGGNISTARNNLITGNCTAMSNAIPGTPPPYTTFVADSGNYVNNFTATATNGSNVLTSVSTAVTAQIIAGDLISDPNHAFYNKTVTAVGSTTITLATSWSSTSGTYSTFSSADPHLYNVRSVVGAAPVAPLHLSGPGAFNSGAANIAISSVSGSTLNLSYGPTVQGTGETFTSQWNSGISQFCRAGGATVALNMAPTGPVTFQDNTVITDNIGIELEFGTADTSSANTALIQNNVFISTYNAADGRYYPPIYSVGGPNVGGIPQGAPPSGFTGLSNPGGAYSNNSYWSPAYNSYWPNCPYTTYGETNSLCYTTTPGLVDQTLPLYGYSNMQPAAGSSAVVRAGTPISGITTDLLGNPRSATAPTIGAYEDPFFIGGTLGTGHTLGNVIMH